MSDDYKSTIIVTYHCRPRDWYFAEVDPEAGICRFGPFDSENTVHEVLSVIYLDSPHLEVIGAPGDYDDVSIWRTAKEECAALSVGHRPAEQAGQGTEISWWRHFLNGGGLARSPRRAWNWLSREPSDRAR